MKLLDGNRNNRILVVDDNEAIHEDFRKILLSNGKTGAEVDQLADALFDETTVDGPLLDFQTTHALQGQEALQLVLKSLDDGLSFAVAFVDVRMPPGWNGIETVERIWQHDDEIEVVLCTAYSDFSWEEIAGRLTQPERLLILRKPFDPLEVRQLAYGLTAKWFLRRQAACRMQDLEIMVEERMSELELLRARLDQVTAQQRAANSV